jgi:4-hydroxymandelate oxidase
MSRPFLTRRTALAAGGALLARAGRSAQEQALIGEPPGRVPPPGELVNAFEFEQVARRKLDSARFAEIAGNERRAMDRITFNPRMMVNTQGLDLTTPLLGEKLYAPILIGPIAEQKRYHPEGELAMVRGAAAANTAVVIPDRSSVPIEAIAENPGTLLWKQIYPGSDARAARARAEQAVKAGCKAVMITAGVQPGAGTPSSPDWNAIDQVRQGIAVPAILKGVMTPQDAQAAVSHGFQGIVVSNYGGPAFPATDSSILALAAIVDEVGNRAAVLLDGGVRRGSDVLKALALGAHAVLLGRPAAWSLAAYGSDGVQNMLQLIQNELGRDMVMCGLLTPKTITRAAVTIHRR